jgi:hypothetical protein
MGLHTKTDWPSGRRSWRDLGMDLKTRGAEWRPLLKAVTKQHSEDRDWQLQFLCDSYLFGVVTSCSGVL